MNIIKPKQYKNILYRYESAKIIPCVEIYKQILYVEQDINKAICSTIAILGGIMYV